MQIEKWDMGRDELESALNMAKNVLLTKLSTDKVITAEIAHKYGSHIYIAIVKPSVINKFFLKVRKKLGLGDECPNMICTWIDADITPKKEDDEENAN